MLDIKTFQCNMLAENCYVVNDDSNEAVIIDCGAVYPEERQAIAGHIARKKLKPVHLLCTHGHLDHCMGNAFILQQYGLMPEVPTPGHTPGSVIFYCEEEKVAFSGDTLFRMSIGRTDFERGSWTDMMKSLHEVVGQLPKDVTVYCGHGPATTIGEELVMNPYLRS